MWYNRIFGRGRKGRIKEGTIFLVSKVSGKRIGSLGPYIKTDEDGDIWIGTALVDGRTLGRAFYWPSELSGVKRISI